MTEIDDTFKQFERVLAVGAGIDLLNLSRERIDSAATLRSLNINELIAADTAASQGEKIIKRQMGEWPAQYDQHRPGMWAFLRDKHGAATFGEALDSLRRGDVQSNIVALWIEEGILCRGRHALVEFEAVQIGYSRDENVTSAMRAVTEHALSAARVVDLQSRGTSLESFRSTLKSDE